MATFGSGGSSSNTFNYEGVVAASLANYRKTLVDNVSKSNPLFHELSNAGFWESQDGGLFIQQPLMIDTGDLEPYDGYDELPLTPKDGLAMTQTEWRQLATPISISEKERKQNKHRLVSLIESRIKIADIGTQENFTKHFLQGSYAGSGTDIREPYINAANGAASIDPLSRLVMYDPTANYVVGNINQSTTSYWRNQSFTSVATTGDALEDEFVSMYLRCSKGPGGAPKLIWTDMITWMLLRRQLKSRYHAVESDNNFPFENFKFFKARIVWDEDIPDVAANAGAGALTAETSKGTAFFLNSEFLKIIYEEETNFVMTEFQKPINQDVRGKHILWMGNTFVNNRRKQGVIGNIARTLTFS
jgi:hypothetical protein